MAASRNKLLSLDTNLLLDLAAGVDLAHEFRELFQDRRYSLVIVPRVAAELWFFESQGAAEERRLATLALDRLREWGVRICDLSSVEEAIARQFAGLLLGNGLIPADEINDARILAETAVAGIRVLTTSDRHLLDVDEDKLQLACQDADLTPINVSHPRNLLRALR